MAVPCTNVEHGGRLLLLRGVGLMAMMLWLDEEHDKGGRDDGVDAMASWGYDDDE